MLGLFRHAESLSRERRVPAFNVKLVNPFSQFRSVLTSFTLRILFLASFVFFTALVMQQSNFSVFLKDVLRWGPGQIGIMLSVVGLVDFFSEGYLVGRLIAIIGDVPVSRLGILLTAIGMFMVGLVPIFTSLWLLYIGIIFFTIGDGLFEPAMTGLIANATEPHMQGRVQGANQSIQSVARFVAPLLAGVLYEMSASAPYFVSAALLIVAFLILVVLARSLKFVVEVVET